MALDARQPLRGHDRETLAGEGEAFADGLLAHLDAAHNLATWLVGNESDAQDIVQESFLRAIRSAGSFRGGSIKSWVLAIIRNACFDHLRRGKASPVRELSDDSAPPEDCGEFDPKRILERAENIRDVQAAISQLPPEMREVIVLREMEGLSYREIAGVAGVPMGTVMSRLARGRRILAMTLSAAHSDDVQRAGE
jgi:RNA polymerase sigma-70 factor (ECF subfamily)